MWLILSATKTRYTVIPLSYGESSLRISSWYVSPLFLYDPSNSYFWPKIVLIGIIFSYNNSPFFSSHNLAWTCLLHLKFQSVLVSFISQSFFNRFQYNLYYYLPYTCSTSATIFRLILSFKVIPEYTLHSRVKDSIAHSSTVICSSNFKRGLLYVTRFRKTHHLHTNEIIRISNFTLLWL